MNLTPELVILIGAILFSISNIVTYALLWARIAALIPVLIAMATDFNDGKGGHTLKTTITELQTSMKEMQEMFAKLREEIAGIAATSSSNAAGLKLVSDQLVSIERRLDNMSKPQTKRRKTR